MDRRAALTEARLRAEQALAAALGDATMCRIHRDGRVTDGAKYAEGRLVALADLERRLRGSAPADFEALARSELQMWNEELARHRALPAPSLPWLAYRQGGCDALAEVIGEKDEGRRSITPSL